MAIAFARAADEVASLLVAALHRTLFSEGARSATDRTFFDEAWAGFYAATEDPFHDTLDAMLTDGARKRESGRRAWLATLSSAAEGTFARCAPVPIDDPKQAARIVTAFKQLRLSLRVTGRTERNCSNCLASHRPNPQRRRRKEPDVAAETDKRNGAVDAVLGWQRWLQLDVRDSRAAKARLRRAASAFDALLLAETHGAHQGRDVTGDERVPRDADERLAALAMTLAHVETSSPTPFAAALGFGPHGGPPTATGRTSAPVAHPVRRAHARRVTAATGKRFARASRRAVGDSRRFRLQCPPLRSRRTEHERPHVAALDISVLADRCASQLGEVSAPIRRSTKRNPSHERLPATARSYRLPAVQSQSDDLGRPKTATIGGTTRQRISAKRSSVQFVALRPSPLRSRVIRASAPGGSATKSLSI